jgi:Repeat of unknown function (DUF5648)/Bacterial Ig domain
MGKFSASSYATAGARIPSGLETALQRDLKLTGAEYLADAAAAAQAVRVVASLKSAGVHVLGSKIHGTSLTVNVASGADAATVAATGATPVLGSPVVPDFSQKTFESVATPTYGGQGYFYQDSSQIGSTNGYRCSIGFSGHSVAAGVPQFVTAGHCATAIAAGSSPKLITQTAPTNYGGTATATSTALGQYTGEGQYGSGMDYGIVGEGTSVTPQPSIYTWGGSTGAPLASSALPITGETAGVVGANLCKSGSTSGWTCGTILAVDDPTPVSGQSVNSIVATTCLLPGDSGGGAVVGSLAVGVDSGSDFPPTNCSNPNAGTSAGHESVFFPMVSAAGSQSVQGQQGANWELAVSVSTPVVTSPARGGSISQGSSITGTLANASSMSTVSLYVDGSSTATVTAAASSGSWSLPVACLAAGSHSYSVIATWGTRSTSAPATSTLVVTSSGSGICEQPVYRFYEPQSNDHFYTMSLAERNEIIATYPSSEWTYEGVAFHAFPSHVAGSVPLYRFWSAQFVGHFFTASEAEKNSVIANYPPSEWNYEGIAFYVYPATWKGAGSPVFRFWSPSFRQHFYTQSAAEKNSIIANDPPSEWTYEGINFYLPSS